MLVVQEKTRQTVRDGEVTKVPHKVYSFGDEKSLADKEAYRAKKAKAKKADKK